MKKLILFFFFLNSTFSFSQTVRAFGTFGVYRAISFEGNGFANFGGGLELKIFKHLRPEIEATYYIGALPNVENFDYVNSVTRDFLVRTVSAVNYSLSPKIMFDVGQDDLVDRYFLQITPKFNFTNVTATGEFFELNNKKTNYLVSAEDTFSEKRQSFGIAIGLIMQFWKNNYDALAFNLFYNNIDIGNSINQLKFKNNSINTSTAFGAGLSYYLGFTKKKIKK